MADRKSIFTLVELLVVIAIITIRLNSFFLILLAYTFHFWKNLSWSFMKILEQHQRCKNHEIINSIK